jgi:hypothetical protein
MIRILSRLSNAQVVGWLLILAGIVVFLEIIFHYYNTPFGYGDYDGLMVAIFLPIGIVPFALGVLILAVTWIRKRLRQSKH